MEDKSINMVMNPRLTAAWSQSRRWKAGRPIQRILRDGKEPIIYKGQLTVFSWAQKNLCNLKLIVLQLLSRGQIFFS